MQSERFVIFVVAFLKMVPFAIRVALCQNFPGRTPPKFLGMKFFLTGDWINGNHSRWVLLTGLLVWGFLQGGLGEPQTLQGTWGGILTLKKGQS